MKLISTIVINYNTPAMTERAIRLFIDRAGGFDYEIILIDNNSSEKNTGDILKNPKIKFIQNTANAGFAKAVNQGIRAGKGDYFLLLNSDALVEKNCVKKMLDYIKDNESAGIIGPKFVYPDGQNQISSGRFPNFWSEFFRLSMLHRLLPFSAYNKDFENTKIIDWVSGGCMLIKRQVVDQVGYFDEDYFFSGEDMDFCLRAKNRGWQTVYYPDAVIVHFHSFSLGGRKTTKTVKLECDGFNNFFKKNFPEKKISRLIIWQMHNLKILVFKMLGYK